MVEKHQSLIAQRFMDMFQERDFQVYVENLPAKPILFTKNMVVAYASVASDYIFHPREGEPSLERQKDKDSFTITPCTTIKKTVKKRTEIEKRKETKARQMI